MSEKKKYTCEKCKTQFEVDTQTTIPSCCGHPMRVRDLDQCKSPSGAEHARFKEEDAPCDDGRAG